MNDRHTDIKNLAIAIDALAQASDSLRLVWGDADRESKKFALVSKTAHDVTDAMDDIIKAMDIILED